MKPVGRASSVKSRDKIIYEIHQDLFKKGVPNHLRSNYIKEICFAVGSVDDKIINVIKAKPMYNEDKCLEACYRIVMEYLSKHKMRNTMSVVQSELVSFGIQKDVRTFKFPNVVRRKLNYKHAIDLLENVKYDEEYLRKIHLHDDRLVRKVSEPMNEFDLPDTEFFVFDKLFK